MSRSCYVLHPPMTIVVACLISWAAPVRLQDVITIALAMVVSASAIAAVEWAGATRDRGGEPDEG